MEEADLSTPEAYDYVKTKIDIDNFIDYQIFELFAENKDWPANNMRCWQVDDGKWRWIFFDGDACVCWMTFTAFDNAVYDGEETWPSNWKATLFFRRLLENEDFLRQFKGRFYDLLNTTFSYEVTRPIFEGIKMAIENEVPYQSGRFGFPVNMDKWNEDMGNVNWFLKRRAEFIQASIDELEGVDAFEGKSLSCYPNPTTGEIHVIFDSDSPGKSEIAIYDLMGRKVFAKAVDLCEDTNEVTIHPNLNAGVYALRIGKLTQKIVKY